MEGWFGIKGRPILGFRISFFFIESCSTLLSFLCELHLVTNLLTMCELMCRRYNGRGGCGHTHSYDFQLCKAAFQRPNHSVCVPASGNLRDLDRVVDIQDDRQEGPCPYCRGETPPSSQGSAHLLICKP